MAGIAESTRKYQHELTELAIASNIIIVLDTGSGKTHIAARVLTHYENLELQRRDESARPRQISFLLVPTVTLVEQQTDYVARTLRMQPMPICGAMNNMDRWSRENWGQLLESHSVIVCTGEILNQALAKRYITIPKINLIIFDEAHHTKSGHPYAVVMKRYKECDEKLRPRILGMTASPVESTDRIEQDLAKLEKLMDAKITTSTDGSLLEHVHRPREVEWDYLGSNVGNTTDLQFALHHHVQIDALARTRQSAVRVAKELGTWCADRIWQYAFEEVQLPRIQQKIDVDEDDNPRHREKIDADSRHLRSAVAIVRSNNFDSSVGNPKSIVSSKVLVLYEKLQEEFASKCIAKCIVFVRERSMARALFDVFKHLLPINGMVPTFLVGMGSSSDPGEASNSWNRQKKTMKAFRNGLVNCIFATQVAEEGVDIPACNLVVRFNPYSDIIQYVQSRGRARMNNSVYAIMTDISDSHSRDTCNYIRECESWLQGYYANLSPDRLVNLRETSARGALASKYEDLYFETKTSARCDLDNSLSILEHYANSLQYENIAANRLRWLELPGKKFTFVVQVPLDASHAVCPGPPNFPSQEAFADYLEKLEFNGGAKVLPVQGHEIYHKGFARHSAAFNACRILRKMALLDENLDTIHKKKLEAMDHVAAPRLDKALQFAIRVRADFWSKDLGSVPGLLYATVFSVTGSVEPNERYSPLVLLTRRQLPAIPSFPLLYEDDVEITITASPGQEPLHVEESDLELLTAFTLDGVYADVFNKRYGKDPSQMQYWLAPAALTSANGDELKDIVDLCQLRAIRNGHAYWNIEDRNPEAWCDKFLVSAGELGRWTYISSGLAPEANVDSPIPATAYDVPNKNKDSVFKFTASASLKWKEQRYPLDREQPVLHAVLTSFRRDYRIAVSKEEKARKSYPCMVCPQPLKLSPLSTAFARSCLLFPSIWAHINDRLIADEVSEQLGLDIPTDTAVEALTYVTEEETKYLEYDMAVQKYPNKNYERLEFYGDTFLKLAIVLILFLKLDRETALNYHVKKKELISNHNLSTVVRQLGLEKYMRSGQVERREFWPANLKQLSGKKARHEAEDGTVMRSLHQKSIADVAESIIGATLVANFDKSERFDQSLKAVTKLVQSSYHDIDCWTAYTELYSPPSWQSSDHVLSTTIEDAEALSAILGYSFKHPNLVRSALTHKSYTSKSSVVPNYERLEILGDGLYDMTVADFLFHKYPDRGPQFLTEHKDVMVSNKFMAYLCVKLNLHRYIHYASSADTVSRCNSYVAQYHDAVDNDMHLQNPNFWYGLEAEPKMFADVIEALVGAMFIDSNFDFGVVEKFFNQHVKPHFEDQALHSEVAHAHPVTVLVHFLKKRFKCLGFHAHTEAILSGRGSTLMPAITKPSIDSSASIATSDAAGSIAQALTLAKLDSTAGSSSPRLDSASQSSSSSSTFSTMPTAPLPQSSSSSSPPLAQDQIFRDIDPTSPTQNIVRVDLQVHRTTLASSEAQSGKVAKARAAREALSILKEIAAKGYGVAKKEFVERFGCGCKWTGEVGESWDEAEVDLREEEK